MTSISRTAYPRFRANQAISQYELSKWYSPTEHEVEFVRHNIRGDNMRLGYLVQLKTCQRLGYFHTVSEIPKEIINHIKSILFGDNKHIELPLYSHDSGLYRHRDLIREQLNLKKWGKYKENGKVKHWGMEYAINIAKEQSSVKNDPADIISTIIEKLRIMNFELPSYAEIDGLVIRIRAEVNDDIFKNILAGLDEKNVKTLKSLLIKKKGAFTTQYHILKKNPTKLTITHFRDTINRYRWIYSLGDYSSLLANVSKIKIAQFAEEARSLDAHDLKRHGDKKMLALIVCLAHTAKISIKDDLAQMFCRAVSKTHKKAKEKLKALMESSQKNTHDCLNLLSHIIQHIENNQSPDCFQQIISSIDENGGLDQARTNCDNAIAQTSDDHIPLMWEFYKNKRSTIMNLLNVLDIKSATQNDSLIKAMRIVLKNAKHDTGTISTNGDLRFVPDKWIKHVTTNDDSLVNHRYYELCVISCLANELRSGDVYIDGADSYSDYRNSLISWDECKKQINDYTLDVNIQVGADKMVEDLKERLSGKASLLDKMFPDITELEIDKDGRPTLKKRKPKVKPATAIRLSNEIRSRMPERNIMDVLANCHHYSDWASVFSPISGSDPKLKNPTEKYILTSFTYGTCMGPAQAARHIRADISEKTLSKINRRHVLPRTLESAMTRIINNYNLYPLKDAWGDGKSVSADGTMKPLRDDNLISEFHVRYCQSGGIAYHHVSNNYIALFSTFIPCGVWEAVHILEALLKNKSDIQPDTIHADTQGQSTVVFALSYLLGIKLMPRIRNWKDLNLYKHDKRVRYKNIDSLFSGKINWDLIKTHWNDVLQAVLSIKAGVISSSLLLRKLTNYSRKNRLFKALHELGKVIRTIYLLEYISDVSLREKVTEETNKAEAYNNLSDWVAFGSKTLTASNDPDEMEKAVKYNELVTNCIMLQNVIDMTTIINDLRKEGMDISRHDVSFLSPYLTEHIKRFGDYIIDLGKTPRQLTSSEIEIAWVS